MKNIRKIFFWVMVICCSKNHYAYAMDPNSGPSLLALSRDRIVSDILKSDGPVARLRELQSRLPGDLIQEIEAKLSDTLSLLLKQYYELSQTIKADRYVESVCISNDNELIITGGGDSCVNVWRLNGERYEYFQTLPGHFFKKGVAKIGSVLISSDKNLIITGSIDDDSVNIWKFNGSEYTYFQRLACNSLVLSVAISQDQKLIIVGCDDHALKFWHFDGNGYNKVRTFYDRHLYPKNLKFSSDKEVFIFCSTLIYTPSIYVWKMDRIGLTDLELRGITHRIELSEMLEIPHYALAAAITSEDRFLHAASLSEDKYIVVVASEELNVLQFNSTNCSYSLLQKLSSNSWAEFVKISYDKSLIMAGGLNAKTNIWKFVNGEYIKIQELDPESGVSSGELSVDGAVIALPCCNGRLNIWKKISLEKLLEIYTLKRC
ncbi:MAG: hypothetical protein V1646_00825 [bacterium]